MNLTTQILHNVTLCYICKDECIEKAHCLCGNNSFEISFVHYKCLVRYITVSNNKICNFCHMPYFPEKKQKWILTILIYLHKCVKYLSEFYFMFSTMFYNYNIEYYFYNQIDQPTDYVLDFFYDDPNFFLNIIILEIVNIFIIITFFTYFIFFYNFYNL